MEADVRVYLLNIRELMEEGSESALCAEVMGRVDGTRRQKAQKAGTLRGKAASLGAGLLLQKAALDWTRAEIGEENRAQSLICVDCTVRELLAELPGVRPLSYRYGPHGKPYFADIPLYFSISHSGSYVLLAVSRREIGADIQEIRKIRTERLVKRLFGAEEQERLKGSAFFLRWAEMEAKVKLTGQGIAGIQEECFDDPGLDWREVIVPEGYAAAVCGYREKRMEQELDHETIDEVSGEL